ncbi:hypothetical protein GIB67_024876 [Kingdonia uniflora]|uniref:Uncharacterized protein n=1 Tax=Kingdonia uniflora TaxID=39325 RepID=A0A7J7NZ89_9MAGN|nr:hypothetical protein GIB67_024876 [Kingdonia uniflora]
MKLRSELILQGMRTYDYILAMREENQSVEVDPFSDSDSSSDESDFDSPEKSKFISRFICKESRTTQDPMRLSIRIDVKADPHASVKEPPGFRASIDPWKLIKMSSEKARMAADKARERFTKQKPIVENESLKPLPLETKCGPLSTPDNNNIISTGSGTTPLITKGWFPGSPGMFSSPRRRYSGSPTILSNVVSSPQQKYRSNFDLKLTEVSRELEMYISRQVVCSALKKEGDEESHI